MPHPLSKSVKKRRPYGFIHNINLIYFTFTAPSWFYQDPGYSEGMVKRSGYHFDGQVFYRKKAL